MNELEKALPEQYSPMLAKIDSVLPLAKIDTENFNKSSSQFKMATLDVVDLTPINSVLKLKEDFHQRLQERNILQSLLIIGTDPDDKEVFKLLLNSYRVNSEHTPTN